MATKVPQRTPWEPLLDANRTPEFAIRMLLSRRYSDFIFSADPKLQQFFDYCTCVRLLRLNIIAVEVYCHVCHCQSHLLHSLGG